MSDFGTPTGPLTGFQLRTGPHGTAADAGPGDRDLEPPVAAGLSTGRLLGTGGSSSVWLVTDDDERRFALKVALPSGHAGGATADPQSSGGIGIGIGIGTGTGTGTDGRHGRRAARPVRGAPDAAPATGEIERELTLLQRFSHEHLLRVQGVAATSQGPGLIMDLAPGGSLLQLVTSRGPLPIPEVVTSLVPVAQVLHHLHQSGALHGDVTPGNILFTSEGKPLLADFATGRLLGGALGSAAGTPGFLDPGASGSFNPGGDVFALAAVTWFALTGRVPGPTEQRPPLALIVPDVPPALMQLVEDCLSPSRAHRPTADHFARSLLSCATPGPVNLVPSVHADVLPELLTRRASAPPAAKKRRWNRRINPDRPGREHGRHPWGGDAASSSRPARQRGGPSLAYLKDPTGPSSEEDTGLSRENRVRQGATIAASMVAAVLLLAGIVLTVGGLRTTGADPDRSGGESLQRTADGADDAPGSDAGAPGGSGVDGTGVDGTGVGGTGVDGRAGQRRDGGHGGRDGVGSDGSGAPAVAEVPASPVAAVQALAVRRAAAFTNANPSMLEDVNVEGSPAMSADREAVTVLADSGRRLQDLSITIRDPVSLTAEEISALPGLATLPAVAEVPAGTDTSLIRATAALSSYTEAAAMATSATEQNPEQNPQRDPVMAADRQELIFILWDSGDGWKIHSVVASPA